MDFYGLNTYEQKARFWKEKYDSERAALGHTLTKLPNMTADIIRMHYLENKTLSEIAKLIGKSISTVRNHHDLGIFKIYQVFQSKKEI
jgi:RNA polymerase sigma factor (sigma-70 family)